jgi:DNA-binding response OmpR family regulator
MPKKAKVLIIEDEESLAQMYQTKFDHEGYEVVVANDGSIGIEQAQKTKPDIILLDIILPKKDGFMVLKELKSDKSTAGVKVIMLTNLGQDEDVIKGKKLGAIDYLVKANLTPAQLVAKVEEYLK